MNKTHQIINLNLTDLLTNTSTTTDHPFITPELNALLYNNNFMKGGVVKLTHKRTSKPLTKEQEERRTAQNKAIQKWENHLTDDEIRRYNAVINMSDLLLEFNNIKVAALSKLEETNSIMTELIKDGLKEYLQYSKNLSSKEFKEYDKFVKLKKLHDDTNAVINKIITKFETIQNDRAEEMKQCLIMGDPKTYMRSYR
jgi:hypothetical protein